MDEKITKCLLEKINAGGKGKIIVIEGSDSSGKATQASLLYKKLFENHVRIMKVEYPNYKSNSSALIKMYLNGEFGKNPEDVNPFASSTFYAVDRFASYQKEWKDFYKSGGIILADRYTTSNMIHQAAKIQNTSDKEDFLKWLWDLEFVKLKLPVPDCVIFLDMPPEFSKKLMCERNNKFTGKKEKDIHEKNYGYLINSYENACKIAKKYNWVKIDCIYKGKIKCIEQIHKEVYQIVEKLI